VFFPGVTIVDFSKWLPEAFFQGGAAVVKFHITSSVPREKHFSTKS